MLVRAECRRCGAWAVYAVVDREPDCRHFWTVEASGDGRWHFGCRHWREADEASSRACDSASGVARCGPVTACRLAGSDAVAS